MVKKGEFKCTICGRVFGMAPHLGRHMSTMHNVHRVESAQAAPVAFRPSAGAGNGARLIGKIQDCRDELAAHCAQLQEQLTAFDNLLAALGGAPQAAAAAPAPSNGGGGSLRRFIEQVLQAAREPMRVSQIADAVKRAGYPTRNKTLAKSVGICLATMPNVTKVDRGLFTAR